MEQILVTETGTYEFEIDSRSSPANFFVEGDFDGCTVSVEVTSARVSWIAVPFPDGSASATAPFVQTIPYKSGAAFIRFVVAGDGTPDLTVRLAP